MSIYTTFTYKMLKQLVHMICKIYSKYSYIGIMVTCIYKVYIYMSVCGRYSKKINKFNKKSLLIDIVP